MITSSTPSTLDVLTREPMRCAAVQVAGTTTTTHTICELLSEQFAVAHCGMIEASVAWWTDAAADSFGSQKFLIAWDKSSGSSTPVIDSAGVLGSILQGSTPPSIVVSVDAASNAIRVRALYNANATVNFIVRWSWAAAPRNQ